MRRHRTTNRMQAARSRAQGGFEVPDSIMEAARAGADSDYRTKPEQLAEALRRRILLGEFAPGSNIPERETSAELGVSRTPLREALRILANEGLVEIRPARSPIVADPSPAELSDMFSVLRVLEALAGELTCMNAADEEIAHIKAIHMRLQDVDPNGDPIGFFKVDMAFHAAIANAARNPALLKTHGEYNDRLWRARFLTSRVRTDRERILREHGEIMAGLEARDTRWTSAVLDSHLRSANRKIMEIYKTASDTLG